MPRVGSSRMRTFGLAASQRARTTFCWLPPESLPTSCSSDGVRIWSRLHELGDDAPLQPAAHEVEAAEALQDRQRRVLEHAAHHDQALALAVLGGKADAVGDGIVRAAECSLPARREDPAAIFGQIAEDHLGQLGPTGPDQAREADDLAGLDLES